jgi:hypothetical protein
MVGICRTLERALNAYKILVRKSGVKRPHWEYVYVDGRVIGKLYIQCVKMQIGFSWST